MRELSWMAVALLSSLLPVQLKAGVPSGSPFVESTTHPIRVFYDLESQATMAATLMGFAEEAWQLQIEGVGFAEPTRLNNDVVEHGFDMWITSSVLGSAGYTFEIQGDNPLTIEADCPVLSIVDPASAAYPGFLKDGANHLLNHASLHAVDCLEPALPAYDMFSIALMLIQHTGASSLTPYLISDFQATPEWPLNAISFDMNSPYYSFGVGLFPLFLDEHFGAGDGKLLVEMWQHTAEQGVIKGFRSDYNSEWVDSDAANTPTYFDAIAEVLVGLGSSFDEALAEFAVWRVLTGSRDDDAHFKGASTYTPVTINTTQSLAALPIFNALPTEMVSRYGTSYVRFPVDGTTPSSPLEFRFAGGAPYVWSAKLICTKADAAAEVTTVVDRASEGAAVLASPATCTDIILAVVNLTEGGYDVNLDAYGSPGVPALWIADGIYSFSVDVPASPDSTPDDSGGGCSATSGGDRLLAAAVAVALLGALFKHRRGLSPKAL